MVNSQFTHCGSFDELLLQAIDEAFSTMGNSVRETLYFCLEKEFKISRTSIPEKVKDFAEALEKIFGAGARLIEDWIIKIYQEVKRLNTISKR
ncbi:MAG: hypothetical protein RMK50_01900 [Nitrososphaerota archaeon]|nr:hypothetical protein [Candidatus Bathyarchaeota archaeon]MDW8193565.1 hypothetical protein [Nitrososphaerota archaeon]